MVNLPEYETKIQLIKEAAEAYYGGKEPVIDDQTYDKLVKEIAEIEKANPELASEAVNSVAAGAVKGSIAHAKPMLSLDNLFTTEECDRWFENAVKEGGSKKFFVEPKLDGLAIAATYREGKLVRVLTRGDGTKGEPVESTHENIEGLLKTVDTLDPLEVRGEVVLTHRQFKEANQKRIKSGKNAFLNTRNGAAGILRTKEDTLGLKTTFYTYDTADEGVSHSDKVAKLKSLGFKTASDLFSEKPQTAEDLNKSIAKLGKLREKLPVDIDGAVVKVDNTEAVNKLGFTAKAPKWATAYKYPADMSYTTLLAVNWQVGRTGVITPRATVTPVKVGGVVIEHASLHNASDIARKGFKIGDTVSIYRAGEVIPKIEAVVVSKRTGKEKPIDIPTKCPECGSDLDKTQERWKCVKGTKCAPARLLTYSVGRDALDIEGLGETLVENLVENGSVETLADIFKLDKETLLKADRVGEKTAENVLLQIEEAKSKDFSKVLTALGIPSTGRTISKRLAKHFKTWDALAAADEETLRQVDGVGDEKAVVIHAELKNVKDVVEQLKKLGVNLEENTENEVKNTLTGKTVCVTGSFENYNRNQVKDMVEKLGGQNVSSVSAKTDILVAGDKAGSKLAKAQSLQVEVWDIVKLTNLL